MADGPAGGGFTTTLPKCAASVEDARQALTAWLEPFALDARVVNRIEVVLEELLSNVVRHSARAVSITITAEFTGDAVSLAVEDDGEPFNPLELAEPERFGTLDNAPLGGLGIPLIKRLSRSVRYERIGANNRVTAEFATG